MPPDIAEPGNRTADLELIRTQLLMAVQRHCPAWLRNDAEDLVQMAMIKVLAAQSEARPTPPSSYLWRVAYSVVIDEIRVRSRRREVALDDDDPAVDPPSPRPDPECRAAGRQVGEAMTECLGRLVPDRRRAVVLRLQGHRIAEIGALLGWRAKRVENLVFRGLTHLRDCLRGKGVEP